MTKALLTIVIALLLALSLGCLRSKAMDITISDCRYNWTQGLLIMSAKITNYGDAGWVTVVGWVKRNHETDLEEEERVRLSRNQEHIVTFKFDGLRFMQTYEHGFELRSEEPD